MGGEYLKTFVRIIISLIVLAAIGFWMNISEKNQELSFEQGDSGIGEEPFQNSEQFDPFATTDFKMGALLQLIGTSKKEVHKELGEPVRIDVSGYGYDWWIYNKNKAEYVQIGIEDGKVVTVYAIGKDVDIQPFYIGQQIGEIYGMNIVDTNINFEYKDQSYRFELSEEDINTNPLIKMNHIFVQLYIDKFTGKLSSIRLMDTPTLIKIRPYELLFRGDGDVLEPLNELVIGEKKLKRDRERQLYELTNMIRSRYDAGALQKDENTAKAAYAHSVDMFESNDFSHTSQKHGELSDRLNAGEVTYIDSGENIAFNDIDAADVVEGWLSSREYRENLLNKEFTHFGAGVYRNYYTQVFVEKQ